MANTRIDRWADKGETALRAQRARHPAALRTDAE